ncbi:MAG: type VI secretion system protein TssL, long form [Gammaproteobacteria bacterium]|nr:type VI secretion system protein TssL, long form [Gammaproteobacteria bacterium]MCP5416192.1 type VI secretion system protein TssL [Chromatiaceae bacterium]
MEDECPKCAAGLPAWLATFADLMSLLMCFFVLLLSFAEIDAIRFKKMADSMRDAFGVQREIMAVEMVKGVSVIKQEFSPSVTPDPAVVNEIRQKTTEIEKQNLDINDAVMEAVAEKMRKEIELDAEALREALKQEIAEGLVSVETEETKIIVRIQEKGSFSSGSAQLDKGFIEVMERIGKAVAKSPGNVIVAGHTDNIPISTARFRSNWELSSARAVTVVHELLRNRDIDPARVMIEGHADSRPLVPNDNSANRAINRRVEVILVRGRDQESGDVLIIEKSES